MYGGRYDMCCSTAMPITFTDEWDRDISLSSGVFIRAKHVANMRTDEEIVNGIEFVAVFRRRDTSAFDAGT